MSKVDVSQIKRSRYINRRVYEASEENRVGNAPTWIPAPGYEDLVQAFTRFKVQLTYTAAFFDHAEDNRNNDDGDDEEFIVSIYDFCDQYCTGMWTMHRIYRRNRYYDTNTFKSTDLDTGDGKVTIHFEKEADIDTFIAGFKHPE